MKNSVPCRMQDKHRFIRNDEQGTRIDSPTRKHLFKRHRLQRLRVVGVITQLSLFRHRNRS